MCLQKENTISFPSFVIFLSFAGMCQQSLIGHEGPIFSLKWNKKGDLLLTGSLDKTAIVWNTKAGTIKQQFSFHSGIAYHRL